MDTLTTSNFPSPPSDSDIQAWTRSCEMDRTAEYVRRGRAHAPLTDNQLLSHWKSAFAEFAMDLGNVMKAAAESDLKCEIELRGLATPFHEVHTYLEHMHASFCKAVERMSQENPAEVARIEREVVGSINDFKFIKRLCSN